MIRAGALEHPSEWNQSGYNEIQTQPKQYSIIDIKKLAELVGLQNSTLLKEHHHSWVEEALQRDSMERSAKWTGSLAVGNDKFINMFKDEMGSKGKHRRTREIDGQFEIREPAPAYNADY